MSSCEIALPDPPDPSTDTAAPTLGRASRPPGAARVLVVEDDPAMRALLVEGLHRSGYDVTSAQDGFKALSKLDECQPDLVLTDLRLPGMDGLDLIEKVLDREPGLPIIVLTGSDDVETAVAAMRRGAVHFLSKPVTLDSVHQTLQGELARHTLRRLSRRCERPVCPQEAPGLVGDSAPMHALYDAIRQIAPSRASVLIAGESGTGKELVAAAIHAQSPRASGPFVKLHCAALAETLLESELFGHERGAFTGASGRREGRFHQADGGTLLLDEVGDIPLSVQVKLLRVLQEHAFERVGGNQTLKVDVRVIAATHRDLREQMRQGLFRADLFYRLNVVVLEVPPLRARRADIPVLAMHFLRRFALENRREVTGFSEDAMARLLAHPWPGNVRELENTIERASLLTGNEVLTAEDFEDRDAAPPRLALGSLAGMTVRDMEKQLIFDTLKRTKNNRTQAAKLLGISIRTLRNKLAEYRQRGELEQFLMTGN